MNYYLKTQITNMLTMTEAFKNSCHMAVFENDGKTDKEEAKALKKIDKATANFIKELNKILEKNK